MLFHDTFFFAHLTFLEHKKNSRRLSQHSRTDKPDLVANRISDQDYLEDKKEEEKHTINKSFL